jgi:hypothetical protein
MCEVQTTIISPDFLVHPIRSRTVADIFRIISAGIPGAGMPMWRGENMHDRDIWAMAHFIHKLVALRGTKEGKKLKGKLLSSEEK